MDTLLHKSTEIVNRDSLAQLNPDRRGLVVGLDGAKAISTLDLRSQLEFSNHYINKALSQYVGQADLKIWTDRYTQEPQTFPIPLIEPTLQANPNQQFINDRQNLLDAIKSDPETFRNAKEYAEGIWKLRGRIAISSLESKRGMFDWNLIFGILGLEPKQGYLEINQAVKEYTKTSEYPRLLEGLQSIQGVESGSFGSFPWLSDDLFPYLIGKNNPKIQSSVELKSLARDLIGEAFLKRKQDFVDRVFSEAFHHESVGKSRLQNLDSAEMIANKVSEAMKAQGIEPNGPSIRSFVETIEKSNLSQTAKTSYLRDRFVASGGVIAPGANPLKSRISAICWADPECSGSDKIVPKFKELGVFNDIFELVRVAPSYGVIKGSKDLIISKLKAGSNLKDDVLILVKAMPEVADDKRGKINSPALTELKLEIAKAAEKVSFTFEEKLQIFRALSNSGPSIAADNYFKKVLMSNEKILVSKELAETFLKEGKFSADSLKVQVTEQSLQPQIQELSSSHSNEGELETFFGKINELLPKTSAPKDALLEKLGWNFHLTGENLHRFVESEKTSSFKTMNPLFANAGSALIDQIRVMPPQDRIRFTNFVIDPEHHHFPQDIFDEETNRRFVQLMDIYKPSAQAQTKADLDAKKTQLQDNTIREISAMGPIERIPILETLLTSGQKSFKSEPDYPLNVIRSFLKYVPNSTEEKMLTAYLKVVPEHEGSVTLAYLMSQSGQEKGGVSSLFEAFQTVGIKFGQMTSVWKVFGEKIAKETSGLKDNAKPLDKVEVESILKSELSPEEFLKIKFLKKVVGSASLKTVVSAELTDGREVVFLIQRPNARQQIESNLKLASAYIEQLKRDKVDIPTGMFDVILADLHEQLAAEIKMSDEATKIRRAQAYYESLNNSLKEDLHGYRFEVPGMVSDFKERDNLLVIDMANGLTWKNLSSDLKAATGKAIAKASIQGLFRDGFFDPDRHGGNFIVDEKNKVIRPIDFGQTESFSVKSPFRTDERYLFARFLKGLSDANVNDLVQFGSKMGDTKIATSKQLDILRSHVSSALAKTQNEGLSDRITAVVNAFADSGLKLNQKYSFGGLKGLMLLQGENYVSPEEFNSMMSAEVKSLLLSKTPVMLADKFKSSFLQCLVGRIRAASQGH